MDAPTGFIRQIFQKAAKSPGTANSRDAETAVSRITKTGIASKRFMLSAAGMFRELMGITARQNPRQDSNRLVKSVVMGAAHLPSSGRGGVSRAITVLPEK
jgi:hypothetical protein